MRFLAVLELYKQGVVELDQPERFGDIEIIVDCATSDSTTAGASLIDAYDG